MSDNRLAELVTAALEAEFLDEIRFGSGGERPHTWASQWKLCGRAMALDLLHPEDRREVDAGACARMAWGNEFEIGVRTRLERAGRRSDPRFCVEGSQEHFRLHHRDDPSRVVLTGKIDGKIRIERDATPFEIKRGQSYRGCRTVADLLAGRWSASSVYQLLAYLLGMELPEGLLVVDSGDVPTLIPVLLDDHLDEAEAFWAAAETASECKHDGADLPDFSPNPEHCTGCDHRGKSCSPPWHNGEGPYITNDPDLVASIETVIGTKAAAKEHAREWERIKSLCRGKELVLIGSNTVTGKPSARGWKLTVESGPGAAAAPAVVATTPQKDRKSTGDSLPGGEARRAAVVAVEDGDFEKVHDIMEVEEDEIHLEELAHGWVVMKGRQRMTAGYATMMGASEAWQSQSGGP